MFTSCHGIAASCPIVPCSVIGPYVMSICVVLSQFMLCDGSCRCVVRVSVVIRCREVLLFVEFY